MYTWSTETSRAHVEVEMKAKGVLEILRFLGIRRTEEVGVWRPGVKHGGRVWRAGGVWCVDREGRGRDGDGLWRRSHDGLWGGRR